MLKNSVASFLWQYFDHPTDSMVMSQSFASGMNLTSAPHVFTVDKATSNLTLRWAIAGSATVAYFNKGYNSTFTANKTLSSPTLKNLDADERIVSLTDSMLSFSVVVAYSSNYGESGDMLRFVRPDTDGNFGAYYTGAPVARRPSSGRRWRTSVRCLATAVTWVCAGSLPLLHRSALPSLESYTPRTA